MTNIMMQIMLKIKKFNNFSHLFAFHLRLSPLTLLPLRNNYCGCPKDYTKEMPACLLEDYYKLLSPLKVSLKIIIIVKMTFSIVKLNANHDNM